MECCELGWPVSGVIEVELGTDVGQSVGVDVGESDG
jgi:hypothetical protein